MRIGRSISTETVTPFAGHGAWLCSALLQVPSTLEDGRCENWALSGVHAAQAREENRRR